MSGAILGVNHMLGDRYVLRKQAWTSPLGPVWVARDRVLDRAVFVQLLAPALAEDDEVRRAFQKTAARTAQVTHPAVLQVFDIGDDPAFVVFEHASNGRLADRLGAGPLRPQEAARAALGLARGLEALHERGAWHGCLSPSNVLFDEEGRAKMLIVGAVECARVHPRISLTAEQEPGYRTGELEPVPADADRYALAALTYHMATGRAPEHPAAPARSIRRSVPAAMDELLRRALSEEPAQRPNLDEFVAKLAPLARVEPPAAREPRLRPGEFRWLTPVVLILLLAAAVVFAGLRVDWSAIGRDEATPTPTEAATAEPLEVESVSDFDPPPGNGEEHPEQVGRAIDGDARSAWETLGYRSPSLAPKSGVGLLFDLGETRRIARVRVQSTRPGWSAEIRVADSAGGSADDFRRVADFTAATDSDVPLPRGTRARYVLLWITQLVDDGSGNRFPHRAAVAEVELIPA